MLQEVVKVELGREDFFLHLDRIGQVHGFLGFFHQGQHVAHAQNAGGHPIGIEGLQGFDLLAGSDEFDRLARNLPNREGGPTPRVAVHFGQDRTCDPHRIIKGFGQVGGFLTDHGIHHQQDFVGLHGVFDLHQLAHHRLVNLQATGGVNQHGVKAFGLGFFDPLAGNFHGADLGSQIENGDVDLFAEGFELVDRGGPVHVGGHHQGRSLFLAQV